MADRETSITRAKIIDLDLLMSEDFNVNDHFNTQDNVTRRALGNTISQEEIEFRAKMGTFWQRMSVLDRDADASTKSLESGFKRIAPLDIFPNVKEKFFNGIAQLQISKLRLQEMRGEISPEDAQTRADLTRGRIRNSPSSWWLADWMGSAAGILPMMLESSKTGVKVGTVTGTVAAVTAGIAGQAGPQVLLPEEIVTIPAAYVTGFATGYGVGTAWGSGELMTGLAYDELLQMVDENGNKIDPSIAKPVAITIGTINGILEFAQIDDLIKTIPGGKGFLNTARRKTLQKLARSKTIKGLLFKGSSKFTKHVAFETSVEITQEINNIMFNELGKQINNELKGTELKGTTAKEVTDRILEVAKESAKGFTVLAAPGSIVNVVVDTVEGAPIRKEIKKAGGVSQFVDFLIEPIEGVSKPRSNATIEPRVDVSEMAETSERIIDATGEIVAEAPVVDVPETPAPTVDLVSEQGPITEIEIADIQKLESELDVGLAEVVSPNLYIGNVTQRMKKAFADALKIDPKRILGFMEKGVPTKRTKIELSRDEAFSLLFFLENDLQVKLDTNAINSHNDMARANADWGDVKTLRDVLDLPVIKRPWKIIQADQTKVEVLLNTKQRLTEAVQPSLKDKAVGTKIDQLKTMLRRMTKATKEGFRLGKKEQKELHAEAQYLRKQIKLRKRVIDKIKKPPGKSIEFFYREAIENIQASIDFKATSDEKKAKKDSLKKYLEDKPEAADEISQEVLTTLQQTDISALSFDQLVELEKEILRLKTLGKLKSKLFRAQRKKKLSELSSTMAETVAKAPGLLLPQRERAVTLRPPRIFDKLDGQKDFLGKIHEFFYLLTNQNTNIELENATARHKDFAERQIELGVTNKMLSKTRAIDGVSDSLVLDDHLTIVAGWKNPAMRAALQFGGVTHRVDGKEVVLLITQEMHDKIEDTLSETELKLADVIIDEYQDNYTRMRYTTIETENRDPGNEVNYTKLRRKGVRFETQTSELEAEIDERKFYRNAGVHKKFTLERKNIPTEYQKPVETGLVKIWLQEVGKQEHYIAHARHIKDMRTIMSESISIKRFKGESSVSFARRVQEARDKNFLLNVEKKFGEPFSKRIRTYIDSIANPDFYKTYDDIETLSRTARQHVAITYLAFRLVTIAKQAPSLMLYWSKSSLGDIVGAASEAITDPRKAYDQAKLIHPQLSHQFIERELAELQAEGSSDYQKIVKH